MRISSTYGAVSVAENVHTIRGDDLDVVEARAQTEKAKVDYLEDNPGMGAEGSTPVSSLLPVFDAVEQGSADLAELNNAEQ